MADKVAELLKKWNNHVPPEVPIDDVLRVVKEKFPDHYQSTGKTGSHFLVISHPDLKLAQEHGITDNFTGGRLSLSSVSGKTVKAYLVRFLLEAIVIVEDMAALRQRHPNKK